MIMLLLFSAMAVDLGLLMTARRQDQSAADTAVIAGTPERHNESVLAQTVLDSLNSNLNNAFVLADLNTCPVETLPNTNWATYPNYNCLAHNQSVTEIRLRVPTQEMDTVFASLGGLTTVSHSAFAQAGDVPRGTNVLPYAVAPNSGVYECLKVGAGNVPDPDCSGSSSGNFGRVVFGLWGKESLGTTQDCTGTKMYEINLAQGLDHDLSRYGYSPHFSPIPPIIDTVACGSPSAPHAMKTDTGNVPDDTYDGLIGSTIFPDGGPSRLQRLGGYSYFTDIEINSQVVDDTPLWEFISAGSSDNVPKSCHQDVFTEGLNATPDWTDVTKVPAPVEIHLLTYPVQDRMLKLMERCLTHYEGLEWDDDGAMTITPGDTTKGCTGSCDDALFARDSVVEDEPEWDIQSSPRFGYVPEMIETTFPSGVGTVRIGAFRAVFLQRSYGGNCTTSSCDFIFDPGFGTNLSGQDKVNALTAFILPGTTLPGSLGDDDAPNLYGKVKFIRLTR